MCGFCAFCYVPMRLYGGDALLRRNVYGNRSANKKGWCPFGIGIASLLSGLLTDIVGTY